MAHYRMQQKRFIKEAQKGRINSQGYFKPFVDRTRCSGCGECEYICSNNVFEMHALNEEERQALPLHSKMRLLSHGNRQSFVVRPNLCEGCGDCVRCCRKHAIEIRQLN